MRFSETDVIELPRINIPQVVKAEIVCNPTSINALIAGHTSSAVPQDLSNFARHLSTRAKTFLAQMGLRKITASLFVSAASNEYWGFNKDGNLCRLVSDGNDGSFADGTIDGYDLDQYTDLAGPWSRGRLEASLL